MFSSPGCNACMAPLQPEDGHDLCPLCLGLEHLKEGLSENSCMNCTIMPRAVRAARLAEVELMGDADPLSEQLTPAQPTRGKRRVAEAAGAPSKKKKANSNELASKVDLLAAELGQMKSLLLALHSGAGAENAAAPNPPMADLASEEDIMSVAASATHFNEYSEEQPSQASGTGSRSSAHGSSEGAEDGSMGAIIRMALARLQLDVRQSEPAPTSAFFRRTLRQPPVSPSLLLRNI